MDRLFSTHNVEEGDTIDVELSVENLLKALRSINATEARIHLKSSSKSHICHFRLTSMQKFESSYFPVSHEIPVQITHRLVHEEPDIDDSDTVLLALSEIMPTLLKLSDRYQFLDTLVTIEGNRSGVFRIHSRSTLGNVTSAWTNVPKVMLNHNEGSDNATYETSDVFSSVTIRAKDWCNVLQISGIARKLVVCIKDLESVYVYCYLDVNMQSDDGSFSYYINHVSED